MFGISFFIMFTVIMAILQISIWSLLPMKLQHIFHSNPVLAFIINMAGSICISSFTGTGSMVGMANVSASVVFGVYSYWYCKRKGIKRLELSSFKLFRSIPIFPKIMVCYENGDKI